MNILLNVDLIFLARVSLCNNDCFRILRYLLCFSVRLDLNIRTKWGKERKIVDLVLL